MKWLPIVDEHCRERLSVEVARSITADDVVRDRERLVRQRGAPGFIRSDNGSEFVARAVQDWMKRRASKPASSSREALGRTPASKASTPVFRDEFLNLEVFGSLLEAKMLGEEHRYKYNHQ